MALAEVTFCPVCPYSNRDRNLPEIGGRYRAKEKYLYTSGVKYIDTYLYTTGVMYIDKRVSEKISIWTGSWQEIPELENLAKLGLSFRTLKNQCLPRLSTIG